MFIICASFFSKKTKKLFVLCKNNLSIDMLIIFSCTYIYNCSLSVYIFVLDLFFMRTVFSGFSRRKENSSRFDVVIMNYLFYFFSFFLCNLFFLLVYVCLFRAPVLLLIDKKKEKKMIIKILFK